MPQPFEQFNMPQLENWTKQQFQQEARKMNMSDKIGDLAHFLVKNFREELTSEEHVVDTAIRLLASSTELEQAQERIKLLEGTIDNLHHSMRNAEQRGVGKGTDSLLPELKRQFERIKELEEAAALMGMKEVVCPHCLGTHKVVYP